MNKIPKFTALALLAVHTILPASAAKKNPFSGNWISIQYTNGKEFSLKLQQVDHELIGWEGKLTDNTGQLPIDLKGSVKGKIADIKVQHRKGYQAHAQLSLRGDKLVWQLLESDNRSSRYLPLASTLHRCDEDNPHNLGQFSTINDSSDQPAWNILAQAEFFETSPSNNDPAACPYFTAYKALLNNNLKTDNISLTALLRSSNPASRLYAAAIIWELSHDEGIEAFKSLQDDNAAVKFNSAGQLNLTTASEIARSFIEKGGYKNFPSKKYQAHS